MVFYSGQRLLDHSQAVQPCRASTSAAAAMDAPPTQPVCLDLSSSNMCLLSCTVSINVQPCSSDNPPLLLGGQADVLHDDLSMSLRGPKTLHDTGMRQPFTEAPRHCMTLSCFMYCVNQRSALQLRQPVAPWGFGFRASGMRQLSTKAQTHCMTLECIGCPCAVFLRISPSPELSASSGKPGNSRTSWTP